MTENLAIIPSLVHHWRDLEQNLADGVLNFGQCSRVYLMRKLKCTEEHAEQLISVYEEDKLFESLLEIRENKLIRT